MATELGAARSARAARAAIVAFVSHLGPSRGAFAALAGTLWFSTRPAAERRRAALNHRRLNPSLDLRQARRLAFRSYRQYVAMICDAIWAETLTREQTLAAVSVSGAEHLRDVGDGGVLAICHFGNWDMAASAALALGVPLTTVMAPIISPAFTEIVALSRREKGLELYPPRQAARGLVRALRRGRFVALMGDVPEAGPTVTVEYCGGRVRFSAVPARLALALKVRLLPVACWREGQRWRLEIGSPLPLGAGDDEAAVMGRVARTLEPRVRSHPEQWYPFHEVYEAASGA